MPSLFSYIFASYRSPVFGGVYVQNQQKIAEWIKHWHMRACVLGCRVVRLKSIEILSNLFRSVIALSPNTLLHCVYLCLNRLAPAYEAIELGIGESILLKAIAQSTGIIKLSSKRC